VLERKAAGAPTSKGLARKVPSSSVELSTPSPTMANTGARPGEPGEVKAYPDPAIRHSTAKASGAAVGGPTSGSRRNPGTLSS
jgi:hypothetical protein